MGLMVRVGEMMQEAFEQRADNKVVARKNVISCGLAQQKSI